MVMQRDVRGHLSHESEQHLMKLFPKHSDRTIARMTGLTRSSVQRARHRLLGIKRQKPPQPPKAPVPPKIPPAPKVWDKVEGAERVIRTESTTVKTLDDLIDYAQIDLNEYEVVSCEVSKWDVVMNTGDGAETVPAYRVFAKFKKRQIAGISVKDAVNSLIKGVNGATSTPAKATPYKGDLWQVLVVADPHFGKYSWKGSTGDQDYDLKIAEDLFRASTYALVDRGITMGAGKLTLALLGDVFHYDNIQGMTTSGTLQDRDGRVQKMLEVGTRAITSLIEYIKSKGVQTDVVIVPGNHDETLTWALHRILLERYRADSTVLVEDSYLSRKYKSWGKNLIGFTHGDKAKKKLPQIMSIEAQKEWGNAKFREIHTGHLHNISSTETIDGVIVRIAPSICPPDEWHMKQGYIGARRGTESFIYDKNRGLVSTLFEPVD